MRNLSLWWTLVVMATAPAALAEDHWRDLFDGESLQGWQLTVDGLPRGDGVDQYLKVHDGMLHFYQNTNPEETVPFGFLMHEQSVSRFALRLEYQWGEKRFVPRKERLRDAGILYHIGGEYQPRPGWVWPQSVECQIQEGDTGDIVFLPYGGLTWLRPPGQEAPEEGQGQPGLLPEYGGRPVDIRSGAYLGRFAELDRLEGWNQVEVVVQGADSALHLVNGQVRGRIQHLRTETGQALAEGQIAVQMEGAELMYRGIQLRELELPMRAGTGHLAISALESQEEEMALILENNGSTSRDCGVEIVGADAAAFRIEGVPSELAAGESVTITVAFRPTRGLARHSAGLQIGSREEGAFVVLQGLGQRALEGANEPPLQEVVWSLGMPLEVGGAELHLDTQAATIGQSVAAQRFRRVDARRPVRLTALARYSPPGACRFGWQLGDEEGGIGTLAGPDWGNRVHQSLLPALEGKVAELRNGVSVQEFAPPGDGFAIWYEGKHHRVSTDPASSGEGAISQAVRVFPVNYALGRVLDNGLVLAFEEASNGDYQDAVFLLENVTVEE